MSYRTYYPTGVLSMYWNDVARTFTTYSPSGVLATTRPYTAEENQRADAEIATESAETNQRTIEEALAASLGELQTTIIDPSNATLNQNPAAHLKTLARAQRRMIRLLIRRFDGTT